MAETLIEARDISIVRHKKTILKSVSLSLQKNEIVALIGPNGAGKTTLVRVLLGLVAAQSGTVERKEAISIGYMPQRVHVFEGIPLSVERFLHLAHANKTTVRQALDEVNAIPLRNKHIQSLSGGEMQRVLLARALLRKPDLLVLDEPVQGVDINGRIELYKLIDAIAKEHHCGVLMVSHDLHLVMATTDKVICLNGHVCCSGHPESVSQHPEYNALFGNKAAQELAIYTHVHDHKHTMGGEIVRKK